MVEAVLVIDVQESFRYILTGLKMSCRFVCRQQTV